jgi:EAL domain-containing protein (putative c-di-GMP-specific phosphodiesterase class I)
MIAAQRNDNRHFFYQWVIHAMVLLALGGFIAYSQYCEFRRIDSQEQERLAVQAETVERNLAPQLALASRVLDSVLLEMPYWQAQQGGIDNGNRQLRIINDALIGLRPIVMLDARGKVSAASDAVLVGRDYAGLASFQAARRDPGAGALHISAPGAGPISLYRAIRDAHGEFGGIVMVSLVPEYFSILLDSVRYAPDVRSAITNADGQVLLRAPAHAADASRDMAARRLVSLRELKAGPPLGQWVLQTACRQLVAWAAQPAMRHLSVAVNVSVRQFSQEDFVEQVLEVLDSTGADPRRLKLELTESLLVANVGDVIAKMSLLKAHGVGFSLDDFGTGYSSLAYLKRLPLDQLKIDQSFVRDVLHDQSDASIAKTIIALARSLNIGVIAEGVETLAQRNFLASSGCLAYQGYFFSRPLPRDEFEQYLLALPAHAQPEAA